MKYNVTMFRNYKYVWDSVIEAESEQDARQKASEMLEYGDDNESSYEEIETSGIDFVEELE